MIGADVAIQVLVVKVHDGIPIVLAQCRRDHPQYTGSRPRIWSAQGEVDFVFPLVRAHVEEHVQETVRVLEAASR